MTRTISALFSRRRTRSTLLTVAATMIGGIVVGPATSAFAADTAPAPAGASKSVPRDPALQPNGYYCGPAATRIALTAHGQAPSFDALATQLGTTRAGTNSAADITRVLNANLGANRYATTEIRNSKVTEAQTAKLQADIVATVDEGDAVVANIAGTVKDTIGEFHSYPRGHYLTVTGYSDDGRLVSVSDPFDSVGSPEYQVPIADMAQWTATRGYSS